MSIVTDSDAKCRAAFQHTIAPFARQPGLPFAAVLSAERICEVFKKHDGLFGMGKGDVYSTAITLWAFIGQVLHDGKEAACQSAVAAVVAYFIESGLPEPSGCTGNYCKARQKLCTAAIRELAVGVGRDLEALIRTAWKGRHAILVDGTTLSMQDTAANQAQFPPSKKKKKAGIRFPIIRVVMLLSLATACVLDLAEGPYTGKLTGETALLRRLLTSLHKGEILVADRYYCSFLMLAQLQLREVDFCARLHASRKEDFRQGTRLGKHDRLVTWTRPRRPDWMDEEEYALIPETLTLRMIRYNVVVPGSRTATVTIVTSLTDHKAYTAADLAELYGYRWHAELDIRSIKISLGLDVLSTKSPEMALKELWVTMLGYNLIRLTAAQAAERAGVQPRQISFTSTCQFVLKRWGAVSCNLPAPEADLRFWTRMLAVISRRVAGHRPGRFEPRVIKRRRHKYPLMTQSRAALKAELE